MQPTHNTLSQSERERSVELLNRHLTAARELRDQMKQSRWIVRQPGFIVIHELFNNVSMVVENYCGLIVERAGGLGGVARDAMEVPVEGFVRVPHRLDIADEHQHVFAVSGALASFGQSAREAIGQAKTLGDGDTAELFAEISRGIELQHWFVETHIAPKMNKKTRSRTPRLIHSNGPKLPRVTTRVSHHRHPIVDSDAKIVRRVARIVKLGE